MHVGTTIRRHRHEFRQQNRNPVSAGFVFRPKRAGTGTNRTFVESALAKADDGELFLEYTLSEAFSFDDNRLKAASFDTAQGFGLRAVSGEAVGYAHATELTPEALARGAASLSPVLSGHSGTMAAPQSRNHAALPARQPTRQCRF